MDSGKVAVVAVVLLGVAGAAVPAIATAQTATPADSTDATTVANGTADSPGNGTGNDSAAFGTQLTAFMQSNAAETNDTVESGMWEAGFERADASKRDGMARSRTDELGDRLERLRERNRTLTERYDNGSIDRAEYVARASSLSGRLSALRASIDGTDRAARAAGVNDNRLDGLRKNATNVNGPEVPGVARGIVSGDRGPPADRGNRPGDVPGVGPGNGNETGNASVADGNNGRGPPDEAGRPGDAGGGGPNSKGGVGGGQSGDDANSQAVENAGPGSSDGRNQGNDRAGESDTGERSNSGSGSEDPSEDGDADGSDDESDDTPAGSDDDGSERGSDGNEADGNEKDGNEEDGDGESGDEGAAQPRDHPGGGPSDGVPGEGPSIVVDPFGVVVEL